MNDVLLAVVLAIYLWVAAGYFNEGRIGMGLAFVAYALANFGLILDVWRK